MAADPSDPLAPLALLPGVAEALEAARAAVDAMLWDRALAPRRTEVVAESALRGAWANAWMEGAECGLAELRAGAVLDGSPMGRVLAGAVRLQAELAHLVPVVGTAPAQALARMHALVAHGFAPDDELGRPRRGAAVDDPLRLGPAPDADAVSARLGALATLLRESVAPGVLVAVVAHAEVATARPFGWGSGLVARALLRLVLAQRGVDPSMMAAPEVGLRAAGRPQYVRALRGYASGTPKGVAESVVVLAGAVAAGAREARSWPAVPGGVPFPGEPLRS